MGDKEAKDENKFVEGFEDGAGHGLADLGKGLIESAAKMLTEARSVVCIVGNDSRYTLRYAGEYQDHGALAVTPTDVPPMSSMTFGAQTSANAFMTGTEGHVDFVADDHDETRFRVTWDNPYIGDNSGDLTRNPESDSRYWELRHAIGGGNQKAEMRYLITSLPIALRGDIRRMWDELSGFDGFLGAPTTDPAGIPGAPEKSSFVDFEGGSIYYSPTTGAWPVGGEIRDAWLAKSGATSPYGLPVGREHDVPGGRLSKFEHGKIYWSPKYGTYAVLDKENDQWDEFSAGKLPKFVKIDNDGINKWNNIHVVKGEPEKIGPA